MSILQRLKKKKHEGFRHFVYSLEQTAGPKRVDIVQKAILEDPIYVKQALRNMLTFDKLIEYSSNDLEMIFSAAPNATTLFARALKHDDCQADFLETMPSTHASKVKDEIDFIKELSPPEIFSAKSFILKTFRDLQENGSVAPFQWQYPDEIVLKDFHRGQREGHYQEFFDDNILACEGELQKARRVGHWKHYYDNGKLMAEGEYVNGFKEGPWSFYHSCGKTKMQGVFVEDSRDGEWQEYDLQGNQTIKKFDKGKPL